MNNFDLSKCKPFDAKAAMEGKPVVNRLGEKRIVLTVSKPGPYPVVSCDENGNGILTNTIKGAFTLVADCTSENDLFMAPETVTVWVNIYKNFDGSIEL